MNAQSKPTYAQLVAQLAVTRAELEVVRAERNRLRESLRILTNPQPIDTPRAVARSGPVYFQE